MHWNYCSLVLSHQYIVCYGFVWIWGNSRSELTTWPHTRDLFHYEVQVTIITDHGWVITSHRMIINVIPYPCPNSTRNVSVKKRLQVEPLQTSLHYGPNRNQTPDVLPWSNVNQDDWHLIVLLGDHELMETLHVHPFRILSSSKETVSLKPIDVGGLS